MTLLDSNIRCASISADGEPSRRIGLWCEWCEEVHEYNLEREPHCIGGRPLDFVDRRACCDSRRSPLAGRTVSLEVDRIVRHVDLIEPPGPYLAAAGDPPDTRVRLGAVLGHRHLALDLLRHLFGEAAVSSSNSLDTQIAGGRVQVFDGGASWFVNSDEGSTVACGNSLGTLLARLFGVPVGVVAVRILKDAIGLGLSPDYTRIIAGLIDRGAVGDPPPIIAEEIVVSLGRHVTFNLGEIVNDAAGTGGRNEEEVRP